ncbi:cytochrome P450 [Corallococcus praedator]|uniref:Cytochrome P450 n=1 Tax=Corallococcus praedator TaxID=2316724 RepID=A0ABX9QSI4_9BACT|nr:MULTISPECIES: cytochrome P450 [Corallococcus]RKH35266.1 cytochrome P450 [Corallococcus sp. CA031C]RKI16403.1 cytochrome P450 [Corallococcus praedator]
MTPPTDPYQAVTHPDPYPYYAALCEQGGLQRIPGFEPWIAADAATVQAVLTSEHCRVRPPSEPVPLHLVDSAAGVLFGRLVRMNDAAPYPLVKQALADVLPMVMQAVATEGHRQAARLFSESRLSRLPELALQFPVLVLGSLLGFPEDTLEERARDVEAYVRSVAHPAASHAGAEAAARLTEHVAVSLQARPRTPDVLSAFAARMQQVGAPIAALVPNAVGLLTQAYEATAGLVGASLLAFARMPELREQLARGECSLEDVVREAARHESPVQNTRRFLPARATLAGQELEAGATVVVVLAAANRDPRVNPQPDAFLPRREARRTFTFGLGAHACPGQALAVTMASAAVERVLASGLDLTPLSQSVTWRASTNARILGGLS